MIARARSRGQPSAPAGDEAAATVRPLLVPPMGLSSQQRPIDIALRTPTDYLLPTYCKMTTFKDTLQLFDQLLNDTPDHVLQANWDLIKNVCKKLNKGQGSSAVSLLEALESSRNKIEKYTELPVERAVARPVDWAGVDLRVHDIRLGATRHDSETRFRKGMGERSLALQYHEWEMREFRCSRLEDLCRDPASYKEKTDGNIVKFIAAHDLPKIACVEKGIQHGTRLLLLESLTGTTGTSAILFFAFAKFRAVKYPEMRDLAASMQESAWIATLVENVAPWFEDCCRLYRGQCEKADMQPLKLTLNRRN
jgi:hypothetical protein